MFRLTLPAGYRRALVRGIAGASFVALPVALPAQTISGRVVDSASGRPLSGVLVVLLDAAGATRTRDLSDGDGAYHLVATAGEFRIRTLRIGFKPFTSATLRLADRETLRRDLVIASNPVRLDTVRVLARDPCRTRPQAGLTGEIWEQARTAIAAAQLTAIAKGYEATILMYERTLTPNASQVKQHAAWVRTGHTLRPWTTLSRDSIQRTGYVYKRGDGALIYYAPDLELLLSDDFASDHCFRAVRERDGGRVGVAFEPVRDRRVPEIRGTVWLDPRTAELREFEFAYTNIDWELERAEAGGDMTFARLSNGGWTIADWKIRMPVVERRKAVRVGGGAIAPSSELEHVLTAVQVGGGELVLVRRGRDTLWTGERVTMTGEILDSASGHGVGDARVAIPALNVEVATTRSGRFSIPQMLPGRYTASITRPTGELYTRTFTFVDSLTVVTIGLPAPIPRVGARRWGRLPTRPGALLARDRVHDR